MVIEENVDRARARREQLSLGMQEALKRARDVFKTSSIKEMEFVGVYSATSIEHDLRKVIERQRRWNEKATREDRVTNAIAEILEGIILSEGELSEWLGNAHTLRTAAHDDQENGVDLISEWHSREDGSRLLALAIDVTFGKRTAEEKLERERKAILSGSLSKVKYFRDARGDFMGTRNNLPRVVIGISQEKVEALAKLWIQNDKKALAKHAVQRVILEEIFAQLRAMHDYAQAHNKHDIADAYLPALKIIGGLLVEKRKIEYAGLDTDPVFLDILEQTARIFSK